MNARLVGSNINFIILLKSEFSVVVQKKANIIIIIIIINNNDNNNNKKTKRNFDEGFLTTIDLFTISQCS